MERRRFYPPLMGSDKRPHGSEWHAGGMPEPWGDRAAARQGTTQVVGEVFPPAGDIPYEDTVCSCDDGTHYYLTASGSTWAWNYELSNWKDPSWFLLTNIAAVAMVQEGGEIFHNDSGGVALYGL